MSGEHIWDAWVTKVFAEEENLSRFNNTDYDKDRIPIRAFSTQGIDRTAKVVCERCNTTWMHEITDETKRLLKDAVVHGRPTVLSPADCLSLARFVFMKAVIVDSLNDARRPPFYRQSVRRAFRTTRALPPGFQIWISQFIQQQGRR